MGTAALGGVCSTSAMMMKEMPTRTSMTRKKRMRKGRQSLRGMHFGMAAADCGEHGGRLAGGAAFRRGARSVQSLTSSRVSLTPAKYTTAHS